MANLISYDTNEILRAATEAEAVLSAEASRLDGGAGVIKVDGVRCYVEIDAVPAHTIRALRDEAAAAGDASLVEVCERALAGDGVAMLRVAEVMKEARTQEVAS